MKTLFNKYNISLRTLIFTALGGAAGFSYYYFIGCEGGCAITSNPYISTAYGALMGLILAFPAKRKDEANNEN
ncbi:MAG: hypothetical protein PHW27_10775 [Melioribacteraceae bacterium]|nr:hypothetical protein [Melioribacteraceae bacterium]MDD3559042.1 hypothetical protein [Melioribacteraceae bacterium]